VSIARVLPVIGVFVCLVVTGGQVHAQAADAPNIAGGEEMPWNRGVTVETRIAAREAFLEGNRLFKVPLFSQAVLKYAEALSQWKHPAFYFNLALAEINLGQYVEAREDLERALKYGEEPLRADRFREAQTQLVEVQRHLGRIRVSCPTPGAEIALDGAVLFTGPGEREVWVKAQAHEVAAKKPEYGAQSRRVTVVPGARETVELTLHKLIEDRPWAVWKPWAVVGTGVGLAAASGVLQALSARDYNAYDRGFLQLPCAMDGCTEQQIGGRLNARLRRARLEKQIAFGGYVAAGVALASGVVLLYMNQPHLREQQEEDANPRATGVAVAPVVSVDMLGVSVTVSH
jgi:tetratricopeptide (TPR) repeat protein